MKEIIAQEGCWLTQANLAEESTRTFAHKVYTPNEALWTEWTNEQKEEWEAAHPAQEPTEGEE